MQKITIREWWHIFFLYRNTVAELFSQKILNNNTKCTMISALLSMEQSKNVHRNINRREWKYSKQKKIPLPRYISFFYPPANKVHTIHVCKPNQPARKILATNHPRPYTYIAWCLTAHECRAYIILYAWARVSSHSVFHPSTETIVNFQREGEAKRVRMYVHAIRLGL